MGAPLAASIIGASGYSGRELTRILSRHRGVRVERLFAATSAGRSAGELYPELGLDSLAYEEYSPERCCTSDVVFIALPSGEAMRFVPELLARGKKVIDLGGDFRLKDPSLYERYYRHQHAATDHLDEAVYGLPELNREAIANARLVANPGCYPTSVILPLAPLLREGLIEPNGIAISSMSGVSGAGRSASVEMSFAEVNENLRAYKVGTHQHIPEIAMGLESFAGVEARFSFVPHLVPITRGIHSTIHARMTDGTTEMQLLAALDEAYRDEPFVRLTGKRTPEVRGVACTNYIDIALHVDEASGVVVITSVIDNLIKGAAGQAVQNMNIIGGHTETEGLIA